jgi:hypothetical protein
MLITSHGTTRKVLVLGPVAFKLAKGERGARCNLYEAQLYSTVTPERRTMLCPVIWCSKNGKLLLAQAAIPLTQSEMNHFIGSDSLPDWDYNPWDKQSEPFEYKASDWGWLKGKLVALDYSAPALTTPEELEELIARNASE